MHLGTGLGRRSVTYESASRLRWKDVRTWFETPCTSLLRRPLLLLAPCPLRAGPSGGVLRRFLTVSTIGSARCAGPPTSQERCLGIESLDHHVGGHTRRRRRLCGSCSAECGKTTAKVHLLVQPLAGGNALKHIGSVIQRMGAMHSVSLNQAGVTQ